ncbi:putative gEgh 16 protein [Fusarium proliferatum ET1]|uniref:Probable gEgh 16 protein n=1 Tax=Fusarium proliferatum (strain ET1) TaxID=1227346 RepID=A0A1L7VWY2_FUSPR|nr:putative gEgh 16 protein [Fusarium proliferatum ET1]CZR44920.1 probable gEgh 16 protein [Fusarium proliferatum ET1]
MAPIKNLLFALFVAADLAAVSAHSVITNAVGDAGGSGMALGVDTSTPRDGTRRRPFQQDATRFRGNSADTVGETLSGGDNDIEQGTLDIMEETGSQLPQVNPGGSLEMTVHQVNSDGAGPYTCMINADGTGTSWENIQVTTNVEGNERGRNRDGEMGDFPLVASIPAGQNCTGTVAGEDNVCLVRCQNPARAGPFGGVIPVQMASGNAGNATDAGNTGNAGTAGNGNANDNTNDATNDTADDTTTGGANGNANSNNNGDANGNGNGNGNANGNGNDDDEEDEDETDAGTRNNRRATRFSA